MKKKSKKLNKKHPARRKKYIAPVENIITKKEDVKRTKIRVIGIGGGGASIVSEIASKMKKASFVVANTDSHSFRNSNRKVMNFPFGQSLTHGLGTGMNPDIGMAAAQSEKERIKKILENQDLCILVACLGGGTGSGSAPVFAKISKSLGNITYGIFTLPFQFEGERKMEIAKEALKKIKGSLNGFCVMPNERVFQLIDKTTPLKQAFSVINKNLVESLGGLIETIYEPGLINIDFADFKTISEGIGKLTYLNTIEVAKREESGDAVKELIDKILNFPLYPYNIKGARGLLLNISGEKNLTLSEVSQISGTISKLVNPEAKIILGISQGGNSSGIKANILATGCVAKIFPEEKKKVIKKKVEKKESVAEKPLKEKAVDSPKPKVKSPKKKVKPKTEIKKIEVKEVKEQPKNNPPVVEEMKAVFATTNPDEKIRKNALQVKREAEELEKEMLEQEKFWETPAFIRRRMEKS